MTSSPAPEPAGALAPSSPKDPELSIVIAAYEAAGTVVEAVESALDQTYPAKEVVVCDDGSTDGTFEAIAPYGDRIVLIRQENRGPAAARNAAAVRASGDFVVNLDADDILLPRNLEARVELIRRHPDLDIVVTDGTVELDGRVLRRLYDSSWRFETEDQRSEILVRCFIAPFWSVRREAFLAAGGFDESISHGEDWECFIRMILGGSRAGLVDEPLGRYRLQRGSLSNQAVALAEGQIRVLEKTLDIADLTDRERARVRARAEDVGETLTLTRLREALLEGSPSLRHEARRVIADSAMPAATRAKAMLSFAMPALARRFLAQRGSETGAGIVIPADR